MKDPLNLYMKKLEQKPNEKFEIFRPDVAKD